MISLIGRVVESSENVFALKKWVILENFVERRSRSKQLENITNADAQAADAGTTAAFAGVNGDSLKMFTLHRPFCG